MEIHLMVDFVFSLLELPPQLELRIATITAIRKYKLGLFKGNVLQFLYKDIKKKLRFAFCSFVLP